MWEFLGYAALVASLLAINMTRMKSFRWLHLLASGLYLAYGISLNAMPIMVGATLFMGLHLFHLGRIYRPILRERSRSKYNPS